MVKTRIDVFPGPLSTSAHVLRMRKAAVCTRPMTAASTSCTGRARRRVATSQMARVRTPTSTRSAAKSKGPEYERPTLETTHA